MRTNERRSARRFGAQLPLLVRWVTGGTVSEAIAESRNVSSGGLYFLAPKGIEDASPIEIVMTLPHTMTRAGPIRVRCRARIQRTEGQPGNSVAVAVRIESYEFLRRNEKR